MKITFDLDVNGFRTFPENELETDVETVRNLLEEYKNPDGVLHFEDSSQNISFKLGDSMGPLIYGVCFGPIKSLAAGIAVDVPFFSCEAVVRFAPDADDVVISWGDSPQYRFRRSELLSELVSCGERYVAIMKRIHENNQEKAESLKDLEAASQAARKSLAA